MSGTKSRTKALRSIAKREVFPARPPQIGIVSCVDAQGNCFVSLPHSSQAILAAVLSHLPAVLPGQSVLLQFVANQPVVMGVLSMPQVTTIKIELNNQTVTVVADERLVLRCGLASVTLEADGTIELRGTNVLSRASGQNALRGASVTLN